MYRSLCLFAVLVSSSAGAAPPDLADHHLNVLPRTQAETARIDAATARATDFTTPEAFEANQGGAATVRARSDADAFSQSSANISFEGELNFKLGNGLFRKLWVSSPSSTLASDGLGPLFNARSCQRCHLKDGRGHPPEASDDSRVSMFLRLSVPAAPQDEMTEIERYLAALDGQVDRTRPDPMLGGQLQDLALPGHAPEGQMHIDYEEIAVDLSGGDTVSLRRPTYRVAGPGYGALRHDLQLSPRVAPPMIGLGLIEAIPASDILRAEDPDDTDGDGISGRAQIVWSTEFDQPMLGRFGWKAGMPTVREQSAAAFSGDIGISTPLFPAAAGDCTQGQSACLDAPHGDGDARGTEIDSEGLDLVTFYSRNLAVPARRNPDDPQVLRGKQVFYETGCTACHTPKFVTHRLDDDSPQSFQLIWPYSDLLLHDMGDGLADDRPEGRANGREWRTPPLWGIGLTRQVNGHDYYLHDGRARSLLEAILWHGGEAEPAKARVVQMPPADRAALIEFLESL
ncbi:di-heme oxidoreductase family protein [Tropicibacter oceani]|uniref:Di-heme oxidoredictase family protein n=1 Tax=Tropicibacter oceani TaxID=3058420 RepID=A0ABY8QI06_9RHOB|nr:di-heme oxidoredictase family protein [Tropicibacter oceani]WGW04279.1 di-heme oxidoredictase family protein [Tropicibacter oceani]